MLYPLKFKKILKEKIWGGRQFEEKLNINLPNDKSYGESWDIACHKNGISIVESGELGGLSLEELINIFKENLLGKEIYEKFGKKFPLLIKYLDINDKLSVQVHPDNEFSLENEGEFGKAECWYVISASSNAKIIAGLKEGINKEVFLEKMSQKDFSDLFNVISVKEGDFLYIEPGIVHATLEGSILICEIQQNSDATYRIYDFDRLVDGNLRPLHLDKATEIIKYSKTPKLSSNISRKTSTLENLKIQELIKCEYFSVDRLNIDGIYKENVYKNFMIY